MPEATVALAQAEKHSNYYFFKSADNPRGLCYLFYPGGRIMPEAYAPYMLAVAEHGIHAFLLRPLFEMAYFDVGVADHARFSEPASRLCQTFALGGHSFGGIATTAYALENPGLPLIIIGSYIHETGLQDYPHPVMLIYGSEDLMVIGDIEKNRAKAPPHTMYRPISGGNHAQMGYYGEQDGDGIATISREQQQKQLLDYTLEIFDRAFAAEN